MALKRWNGIWDGFVVAASVRQYSIQFRPILQLPLANEQLIRTGEHVDIDWPKLLFAYAGIVLHTWPFSSRYYGRGFLFSLRVTIDSPEPSSEESRDVTRYHKLAIALRADEEEKDDGRLETLTIRRPVIGINYK